MSRRKPGAKKPQQKRPKEITPPEPPRRSEASAPPPEPPIIKPELPLPPEPPHSEYKPSVALVVAVVLTAVLEVLDITIVSVAIPHMLGTFGATSDQITWVLTSYLVSAAVVMPLTGYLSARLGRRRLLIFSIVGFVISSALCGLSWNLESMVVFRLLQGICGAPLVPLSQAILLDAFPKEKHGQALAIFGLGIMVAPVLGPTFGGWLTDTFVWRAVFYINVPIGIFALLLAMGHLPKTDIKYLKTDWTGLVLLVLAVGSLQMVLDQGQTRDWFNSRFIQIFTAITIFSSVAFFMRGWNNSKNIVDLSLLKDRNFLAGLLAITAYGVTLFGINRASAAAHPAAHGLSGHERRHAVHPARGGKRHRALHHRQLSDALYRPAHPRRRRRRAVGRRHHDDGGAVATGRRLGHRRAWHYRRHRHGPVLRAADRGGLRQRTARQARRGRRPLRADARHRLLDRHRRGELALRPPGPGALGQSHLPHHPVQPGGATLSSRPMG